jgi:hypothetical protein
MRTLVVSFCGGGAKMKIEKGPINHVVKMKFKVVGYIVAL